MKLKLSSLIASLVVAVLVLCFWVLKSSAEDSLISSLTEVTGQDGAVSLDNCNLSIVVESTGQEGGPIALTRVVLQADLRNYAFNTVRLTPNANGVSLSIERSPVTEQMLAQVSDIISTGGGKTEQLFSDATKVRKLFEAEGSSLFFRVMAEVVTTENGTQKLVAHEDAPDFFRFAEAVEAIPAPSSYRVTTTFAPGTASAETLLTGEVVAIPPLKFNLGSQDQAKKLAQAFFNYANENDCN